MDPSPRSSSVLRTRRILLAGIAAIVLGGPAPASIQAAQATEPTTPTLKGVVWQWHATVAPDGTLLWQPEQPDRYTVTFLPDGALAIQVDCNRARGAYAVDGTTLTLQIGGVTRMRCAAGSLMDQFLGELEYVVAALPAPDGLILVLTAGEAMRFTPAPNVPATPGSA